MPAPKNNRYAAKPAKERASSTLQVRCRKADKQKWTRAAKGGGGQLSSWAIAVLNRSAGRLLTK